ncbi:MAG: hypothetical protein ACHQZQ_06615 [SAR324 cluster bacterium]
MRLLLLFLLAAGLASCATVFNHPAQSVSLTPESSGNVPVERARVLITSERGTYRATIPGRFAVTPDLWVHATVKVVEPCFQATEISLPRHVTGWMVGDLVGFAVTAGASGVFFVTGDVFDGALWSYDRDVKLKLEPIADFEACIAESRKHPGLPFAVALDPVWVDPRYMGLQ